MNELNNIEPGSNTALLKQGLIFLKMSKPDLNDTAAVKERIEFYFNNCIEYGTKPNISGLAVSLGTDRKHIYRIVHDPTCKVQSRDLIKETYNYINSLIESYMLDNKTAPASAIFLLKNHFGYTDVQEFKVTPTNNISEIQEDQLLNNAHILPDIEFTDKSE